MNRWTRYWREWGAEWRYPRQHVHREVRLLWLEQVFDPLAIPSYASMIVQVCPRCGVL